MLVIDRDSLSVGEFRKVELCDYFVPFGGEGYGPRNHGFLGRATRSRGLSAFLIDAPVLDTPFDRVRAFDEDSLHLFVMEQARTVDELVDHPRRQIVWQSPRGLGLNRNSFTHVNSITQ